MPGSATDMAAINESIRQSVVPERSCCAPVPGRRPNAEPGGGALAAPP
jgi:hypothetical protein